MKTDEDYIELLADYFSGLISQKERAAIDEWKKASPNNLNLFDETEKVYRAVTLLTEMRQYNPSVALQKINTRIKTKKPHQIIIYYWQRFAALLLLPVLLLGSIYFYRQHTRPVKATTWQTFDTPPGVKSQVQLPDGTHVWLNSNSQLTYSSAFVEGERRVTLLGEAFFEVAKDKKHPFSVNLGKIGVEVVGTKFNVTNYTDENRTEVVLTEGKIKLYRNDSVNNRVIAEMKLGDQAIYEKSNSRLSLHQVNTDKYTSWIDGRLVFMDDKMDEVVRKLDRWFNVTIEVANPEINSYVYTGTFRHETISQVLTLLKKTSPITYTVIPGRQQHDGSFSKQRIILTKE